MNKRVRNFIVCVGLLACSANLFGMKQRGGGKKRFRKKKKVMEVKTDKCKERIKAVFETFLSKGKLKSYTHLAKTLIYPHGTIVNPSSETLAALYIAIEIVKKGFVEAESRSDELLAVIDEVTQQGTSEFVLYLSRWLEEQTKRSSSGARIKKNGKKKHKQNRDTEPVLGGAAKKKLAEFLSARDKKRSKKKKREKNYYNYFNKIVIELIDSDSDTSEEEEVGESLWGKGDEGYGEFEDDGLFVSRDQ